MGFTKKILSIENINSYIKTHSYDEFKKMMFKSDSYIFLDEQSSQLYQNFVNSDSENQKILYETQKFK